MWKSELLENCWSSSKILKEQRWKSHVLYTLWRISRSKLIVYNMFSACRILIRESNFQWFITISMVPLSSWTSVFEIGIRGQRFSTFLFWRPEAKYLLKMVCSKSYLVHPAGGPYQTSLIWTLASSASQNIYDSLLDCVSFLKWTFTSPHLWKLVLYLPLTLMFMKQIHTMQIKSILYNWYVSVVLQRDTNTHSTRCQLRVS